jgi:hypothetical protein
VGLLDSLFNQATYGGQGGGLLDFLRTTQMQQDQYQPSAGFPGQAPPIGVGGYQMPRMGDVAQFTPPPADPAALPVNAQPAQGQLPQQQPQGFGGFLSTLNENLQTLGNGGSLIGALTGQRPNNQTAQFLVSKGIDPAMAQTIVSDPGLLRSVLPSLIGAKKQTDDIEEYLFAKKEDPALTFDKFMARKKSVNGELGLNLVYGTNDKGETVPMQPSKAGGLVPVQLPPGVKIAKGFEKIDAGTKWILRDKQTGAILGEEPKNVAAKEAEEKIGQAQGAAKVALPAAESTTTRALNMLKQAEEHPGLGDSVGFIVGRLPALTSKAADFRERIEQVDAMVFGDAVEVMRGLGALTDKEGPKVTAARARLKTAKSEEDFRTALKDVREVFETGIENMRQKAGVKGNQAAPNPANDLKKKYGLD